jgi:hypothetical protein
LGQGRGCLLLLPLCHWLLVLLAARSLLLFLLLPLLLLPLQRRS